MSLSRCNDRLTGKSRLWSWFKVSTTFTRDELLAQGELISYWWAVDCDVINYSTNMGGLQANRESVFINVKLESMALSLQETFLKNSTNISFNIYSFLSQMWWFVKRHHLCWLHYRSTITHTTNTFISDGLYLLLVINYALYFRKIDNNYISNTLNKTSTCYTR